MDTMFMNSENSKTSDHHRQFLYKIKLKEIDKYIDCTWKNIKK